MRSLIQYLEQLLRFYRVLLRLFKLLPRLDIETAVKFTRFIISFAFYRGDALNMESASSNNDK